MYRGFAIRATEERLVSLFATFNTANHMVEFAEVPALARKTELLAGKVAALPSLSSYPEQFIPWGLDRIDQRSALSAARPRPGGEQDANYLDEEYTVPAVGGAGVRIYVVDSGVYCEHTEFLSASVFSTPSRCVRAWDWEKGRGDNKECTTDGSDGDSESQCAQDIDGHGTHCAGVAAGRYMGVAKSALIHAVKALNDTGYATYDALIGACDYMARAKGRSPSIPMVASMSLGGARSRSFETAITGLLDSGVIVVSASGNAGADSCSTDPGRVPGVINIGATTYQDLFASYTDDGACLDLLAPGDGIVAAGIGHPTAIQLRSGTSMACPHVAGAAAIMLSTSGQKGLTSAEVGARLVTGATTDAVKGLHGTRAGTPNKLLCVEAAGEYTVATDCSTSKFTYPCMPASSTKKAAGYCMNGVCVGVNSQCSKALMVTSPQPVKVDTLFYNHDPLLGEYALITSRLCNGRPTYANVNPTSHAELRWNTKHWILGSKRDNCWSSSYFATSNATATHATLIAPSTSFTVTGRIVHGNDTSGTETDLRVAELPCRDADGDGYGAVETRGIDCNDDDASVAQCNDTTVACPKSRTRAACTAATSVLPLAPLLLRRRRRVPACQAAQMPCWRQACQTCHRARFSTATLHCSAPPLRPSAAAISCSLSPPWGAGISKTAICSASIPGAACTCAGNRPYTRTPTATASSTFR